MKGNGQAKDVLRGYITRLKPDTYSATAQAHHIVSPETAYVKGQKVIGTLQKKTLDAEKNGSYDAPEGTLYERVNVNVDTGIPDGYILPSGTKEITENGIHPVAEYENVDVQIEKGGELYEVESADELPEDAPNGSLALVEGEPIPEAYTVTSVDELKKIDAVDGSTAIVPSDSLLGKWKWHETLDFGDFFGDISFEGAIYVFYIDGVQFLADSLFVGRDEDDWIYITANYTAYKDTPNELTVGAGLYDSDDNGWAGSKSREMQIVSVTNADEQIINILNSNAERLSGGYSLYTHENGEWVYKCEVV